MREKKFHKNSILIILLLFFGSLFNVSAHQELKPADFPTNNNSISASDLNYEFILLNASHQNELPENPAERTEKDEDENEGKDEVNGIDSDSNFNQHSLLEIKTYSNKLLVGNGIFAIPYYILFHSWKSFLFK